jgi:hypothetical protein
VSAWKRVSEPAPSVGALVPEVGWWLQRLVAACLERDAARRPASVQDVEQMLRGPDSVIPAVGQPHVLPSAPFARRARMAVAGAALLGGAAAGVWLVARSTHAGVASVEPTRASIAAAGEEAQKPIPVVPPAPAIVPPKPPAEPSTNVASEQSSAPVRSSGPTRKPGTPRAPAPPRVPRGSASAAPLEGLVQKPAPAAPAPSADPDDGFIFLSK